MNFGTYPDDGTGFRLQVGGADDYLVDVVDYGKIMDGTPYTVTIALKGNRRQHRWCAGVRECGVCNLAR